MNEFMALMATVVVVVVVNRVTDLIAIQQLNTMVKETIKFAIDAIEKMNN